MFRSQILLWITFDFCVTTGTCAELFERRGTDVKMNCDGLSRNSDIEWKLNDALVLGLSSKAGIQRRGKIDTTRRSRIDKTTLKISSLESSDSGVHTCGSSKYTLYVVSAQANPSTVLYSSETKLSCDIAGGFKGTFQWLTPRSKPYSQSKDVTVKSVTKDDAGDWTCQIKNDKGVEIKQLQVIITVVGPLNTSVEVKAYEGDTAELLCFLPAPSKLRIKGGSWTRDPASDVHFPTLIWTQNHLKWNSTSVKPNRVTFSDQELNPHFNVALKKVKREDAGVYVCNLEFEGGKSLSADLNLTVFKKNGVSYDMNSEDSKERKDTMWYKRVGGMPLWVWVAVAVCSLVLIGLVVIILLIYRRNKRMKRKVKKLKSVRQPLTSRNYCKCDRTVRQPGTGKRERPPPLPRNQYTSLNE